MKINFKISKNSNFSLLYNTQTTPPATSQLQNVLDNRNPMQFYTGNPSLKQPYNHNISIRYNTFNPDMNGLFSAYLSLNYRVNSITNSTTIIQRDSSFQSNVILPAGSRLISPVNIAGYWSTNAGLNYGLSLDVILSKISFNINGTYSNYPSLINNILNNSKSYRLNGMLMLSSNISQSHEFSVSSRANYNITNNSLNHSLGMNYYNFQTNANLKWIIWEGLYIHLDLNNNSYIGIASGNFNNTLLNLSLGKKIFKNGNGDIRLSAYDILNQNRQSRADLSDYYSETYNNNMITRYIMLSFSYNLRNFGF
jgi:hypothetical protein